MQQQIKQKHKDIDVIMITAVNEDEVGKKAMELGAADYITKPLSLNYLETVVLVKLFMKEQWIFSGKAKRWLKRR